MVVVFLEVYLFVLLMYGMYRKKMNAICRSKKRLEGKTCLVTGGTSGLGLEIAIDFAQRGARVIIACPFNEEGKNAEKIIIQESGNSSVVFKLLDLGSFKSVRQFAADIINTEARLDILMNNAGVGIPRKETEDGINIIMQVNYLGHFLLTILLMPLLMKSGKPLDPSRIVNTSSVLHRTAMLDVKKLSVLRDNFFKKIIVYCNSKLCLVLFSRELMKKLATSNVVINNVDPGEVGTRIFLSAGYIMGYILYAMCWFLVKSPFEGAQTPIHAALDEKAGQVSGLFYRDCSPCQPSKAALDDELGKRLWDESIKLVGLKDEEVRDLLRQK
ncbi:hypothetical protein ABMA27_015648 [Loxostege sticticalis]|uniref:Retinol dehydrogenase 11 n=1 Tax=Loxostege sticticalis TaxID=481309 RepID=A0ABR3I8I2_LOXSC